MQLEKTNVAEQKKLIEDLKAVSDRSKGTHERIERIIDIEKVKLRNLKLRASVISRTDKR